MNDKKLIFEYVPIIDTNELVIQVKDRTDKYLFYVSLHRKTKRTTVHLNTFAAQFDFPMEEFRALLAKIVGELEKWASEIDV